MPLLGAHMSVAGGYFKAADAAAEFGMETVQLFTHSPSQWAFQSQPADAEATSAPRKKAAAKSVKKATKAAGAKPVARAAPVTSDGWVPKVVEPVDAAAFREAIDKHKLRIPCAHASYLINVASPDPALWRKSVEALRGELVRAERLGLAGVVMHPGSFVTSDESSGIQRIIEAIDEIHAREPDLQTQVWLENTAGQGSNLGHRFEQLAEMLRGVRQPERLGFCLDTCHLFAAGYNMQTKKEFDAVCAEFDRLVGLKRIRAWHLNDSKQPLGSRVDRHEHIGEGHIGLEPFRHLLNDKRFADLPMYLETDKSKRDGREMDEINLDTLKSLLKK
jgi:deoxyribonuclease-4